MGNVDNIIFEGKNINLSKLSIQELKDILNKINNKELEVKQDLDNFLSDLV